MLCDPTFGGIGAERQRQQQLLRCSGEHEAGIVEEAEPIVKQWLAKQNTLAYPVRKTRVSARSA